MGKTPDELAGLEDGQVDWLYYGIIDKYDRQAKMMKTQENVLEFNSLEK
jgi:hypothetical protein